MKKIIFILAILILTTGCSKSTGIKKNYAVVPKPVRQVQEVPQEKTQPQIALPNYEMLNEKIDDMPIKTQIAQHFLVTGEINAENLKILLQNLYNKAKGRTGFRYHNNPNAIYIYAYLDKERYEGGMGQWVAMLSQSAADNRPTTNVNEEQLSQLGKEPEEKFGLTEEKRKEIWQAIIKAERRATEDSEKQYPLPDPSQAGYTQAKFEAQWNKQIDLQYSLQDKYNNELLSKYGITQDQLDDIAAEGITKSWAFPK